MYQYDIISLLTYDIVCPKVKVKNIHLDTYYMKIREYFIKLSTVNLIWKKLQWSWYKSTPYNLLKSIINVTKLTLSYRVYNIMYYTYIIISLCIKGARCLRLLSSKVYDIDFIIFNFFNFHNRDLQTCSLYMLKTIIVFSSPPLCKLF